MTTAPTLEPWRREMQREALAAGMPEDLALLVAQHCGTADSAAAELQNARAVFTSCRVVGAALLAGVAIASRLPLCRVEHVLSDALPRAGRDRTHLAAAGTAQAKLAFIAAGIYATGAAR